MIQLVKECSKAANQWRINMYTVKEIHGWYVILKNEYKEFARYPLDKLKEAETAAQNMNTLTKDWSGNANF